MVRWRCERCGEIHLSNPDNCRQCRHTVMKQHRPTRRRAWPALVAGLVAGGVAGLVYNGLVTF